MIFTFSNTNAITEKNPPSDKNYCIECHLSLTGKNNQPVIDWRNSIHSTAGNECNICHGGDPSVNDKLKSKSKKHEFVGRPGKNIGIDFCGRGGCHATELAQFKRGPHYQSVLKTGKPTCSDCHGSHLIKKASIDLIKGESCSQAQCHSAEYSKEIVNSITIIERDIRIVEQRIAELKERQSDVAEIEDRIKKTKHLFHELIHVFSNDDIKFTKRIIELEIKNLNGETESKLAQTKRLDILYMLMVGFTMIVVLGISVYTLFMYTR